MIIAGIVMFLMWGRSEAEVEHVIGALPSGTVVILVEDHRVPLVASEVRFALPPATGADVGMAHWVEHLAFRQGGGLPDGEFDRRIEAVGGDTNGWTNQDWLALTVDVPVGGLDVLLEMELARLSGLTKGGTEDVLQQEQAVVSEEFTHRMGDARFVDGRIMARQIYPDDHPYHWSPLQEPSKEGDIVAIAQEYESRALLAERAVWVLVGDFDATDVWDTLSLQGAPHGFHQPMMDDVARLSPWMEEKRLHWVDQRSATSMHLVWRIDSPSPQDEVAAQWAAAALGLGPGSRLERVLTKRLDGGGRVQSVVVRRRHSTEFRIEITRPNGSLRSTLRRIDRVLQRMAKEGLETAEVQRIEAWRLWQLDVEWSSYSERASGFAERWLLAGRGPAVPSIDLYVAGAVDEFVREHLGPGRLVYTVSPNPRLRPLRHSEAVVWP